MSFLEIAEVKFDRIVAFALNERVRRSKISSEDIPYVCSIDRRRVKRILSSKHPVALSDLVNLSRGLDFSINEFLEEIETKIDAYLSTGVKINFGVSNLYIFFFLSSILSMICGFVLAKLFT